MTPKISVIIPSYNKVKYIEKTLFSIFDQSYRKFEVIVQDGGSTDGTLQIIKKYKTRYPSQLFYESEKDGGQLDAINKGLKYATGDIVTYINADDVYADGAFEAVVGHYMENPDALWFVGKSIVIDENDQEIAKFATLYKSFLLMHSTYYMLLTTNYLMQPSVFITKTTFKKYGPFTGTKFAVMEYDLWLKIAKNKMPVVINKVLSKFRIEKDTKTSSSPRELLIEDEKIVKKYTNNIFILMLHKLHNIARLLAIKFV